MAKGRYRHGAPPPPSPAPRVPAPPPPPAPSYPPGWDPWYVDAPRESASRPALVVVGGLVALVLLVLSFPAFLFLMGRNHARLREPQTFDDPLVRNTADLACAALADDLERIPRAPLGAPVQRRRAAIDAENVAVERLVDRMRALGPERLAADPPADQWIADWEALRAARAAYAGALGSGDEALFDVPRDHRGRGVQVRMGETGACGVPFRLLLLLPEPPAD